MAGRMKRNDLPRFRSQLGIQSLPGWRSRGKGEGHSLIRIRWYIEPIAISLGASCAHYPFCNCDCDQESKSWQTHTRSVPEKQTSKASMRIVIFAHWLDSRRKRHRQLTESCSILNSPPLQPVEAFPQLLCHLSSNCHWSLKLFPFYTFSLCKWLAA